jgi:hypothetical protein
MAGDPEPLVKGLRISPTVYAALGVIAKRNRDSIAETADKFLLEFLQKHHSEVLRKLDDPDEKPRKK